MQGIHSERLFAAVTGDRRLLRPANQALKCPRCDSLNTKFCYYNNYNLSQPRHFCKSCRRYWTNGGVLRNVPVGGGCRKSKRSSSSRSSSSKPPPTSPSKSLARDPAADASKPAVTDRSAVIPAPFSELRATAASSLYWGRDEMGSGMLTEMGSFPSLMGSTGAFVHEGMMSRQAEDMVEVDGFGALDQGYWSQLNQWTVADDDRHHHRPGGGGGALFLP